MWIHIYKPLVKIIHIMYTELEDSSHINKNNEKWKSKIKDKIFTDLITHSAVVCLVRSCHLHWLRDDQWAGPRGHRGTSLWHAHTRMCRHGSTVCRDGVVQRHDPPDAGRYRRHGGAVHVRVSARWWHAHRPMVYRTWEEEKIKPNVRNFIFILRNKCKAFVLINWPTFDWT